ncbi:hypothetical protein KEM48_009815 [Puccinia striiformis f. sp. tritici PST-130]|nr:hypothetical protein KEM48_009815 [Puccinia striiformis f. sp. tritici PST-130]
MLSSSILVLLLSTPQFIVGQGHVTSDQVTNEVTQYDTLMLSAAYPDGFGVPLKAQAVLNVTYPTGSITLGKAYSADDVKTLPNISVIPSDPTAFKSPNQFTLLLADANALGNPDKEELPTLLTEQCDLWRRGCERSMALNATSGTVVTAYAGPGPLLNTGQHRYAWMLFTQPSKFSAPLNLSAVGTSPGHWYLASYVNGTGLGDFVAASFFTIENGHATFTSNATMVHSSNVPSTTTTGGSSTSNSSPNSASKNGASSDADGPVWKDCAGIVKSLVMGAGVAVSGFILIQ